MCALYPVYTIEQTSSKPRMFVLHFHVVHFQRLLRILNDITLFNFRRAERRVVYWYFVRFSVRLLLRGLSEYRVKQLYVGLHGLLYIGFVISK